jgi:glycosyltransferase involved in cell wall biosynthesis
MESKPVESSVSTGRIWITWETQRRNRNLAKAFNAQFLQFDFAASRMGRYLVLPFKTISAFQRTRPRIIFSQNPSIVLALISVLYGKIMDRKIIVDAHNAGIHPFNGKNRVLNAIARYIIRGADITIVTNDNLATTVTNKGGTPFVLQDRIPQFNGYPRETVKLKGRFNIFFICTFSQDEPYREVIRAAHFLNHDSVIYISGNPKHHLETIQGEIPDNVVLTGFLPDAEYIRMISSCDLIIDLTTREDCLVCGAYEALGMGKPMLLSDTAVNRAYFHKGVVYTDNRSGDIAAKIQVAMRSIGEMTEAVKDLKEELIVGWETKRAALEERLERL